MTPTGSIVADGHHPRPRADGKLPTTITFLEMRAPPLELPGLAPPASPYRIELVRIERPTSAFYRFLYDSVGRPWLWYERKLLADSEIQRHLDRPENEIVVAAVGGEPAGFFQIDFASDAEAELEFFGLRPEYIGLRLGYWLVGRAVAHAWQRPIGLLSVNTNTLDHPRALPLYRRIGFTPIRTEQVVLQDPRLLWPELYPDTARPD